MAAISGLVGRRLQVRRGDRGCRSVRRHDEVQGSKGGAKLLDKLRRGDVLVVRWGDRLGRSYADVTETIRTLMQRGVVIRTIINGMTFDGATKDPHP